MTIEFFKQGGIFYFDENDPRSERAYYQVEDLMGEEEGAEITEAYVDEDGDICIYYDGSVMDEETAIAKYNAGDFVKHF
ncbi:MAG: hypothetical protein V2J07_10535 [Anaerolineae bacterium]|nr:hypothetical protein [Anaerolineae bacterium]